MQLLSLIDALLRVQRITIEKFLRFHFRYRKTTARAVSAGLGLHVDIVLRVLQRQWVETVTGLAKWLISVQ